MLDGNKDTCVTTAGNERTFFRWRFDFPGCVADLEVLPVMVSGDHLLCGGKDGLNIYVNTAPLPATLLARDMCTATGLELRKCHLTADDSPTVCKFQCLCPIHDGGCKAGLLYWKRHRLPSNQPPGQICEVDTLPGP